MASLYDKVKKEMTIAGIRPRTAEARSWLASKVRELKITSTRRNLLTDPRRAGGYGLAMIGKMYFFHYDAKWKDILPVWDKFPLVLPIELYDDGFLGINLHYLDPYSRLALLDKLHEYINNTKYDDTTRFKLSYAALNSTKRYDIIKPCIKRYLFEYLVSPLVYIEPDSWETAIFLPTEKMVYRND